MVYVIIYGLLAFGAFAISVAPKTCSLWKVGLVFFSNWIITILIFMFIASYSPQVESALSFGSDILSAVICFIVYEIYKCKTSKFVMFVYIAQAAINIYHISPGSDYLTHVTLNSLFILNAIIIICGSIKALASKNRRWHNITCFKRDRRINARKRNQKFEAHYV